MPGVRGPRLPSSPDGQVPQRIPRRSCGSARTRVIRPGWKPTRASAPCSTPLRDDPEGQFGAAAADRFGDALPFLLKVLAADEPLSLQAHPSAEQAVRGLRPRGQAGHSGFRADPQLPRPQPQARIARRARAIRGAGGIPAGGAQHRVDARARGHRPRPVRQPAGRPVRRRRSARAVHHLDHRAAARPRRAGARGDRRRDPLLAFGRKGIRRRSQDRARTRRAVSRRRRRAGVPAAEPDQPARRARPSSCPQATCTPTCRRGCRGDGQLRQRAARRADAQARRRARAVARARLQPGDRGCLCPEDHQGRIGIGVRHAGPGVRGVSAAIDGEQLGHEIDAPTRHDGPQILLCTEGSTVVHAKAAP